MGFEGLYSVSSHGRVRSEARNIRRSTGAVHPQGARIRRLVTDDVGRVFITLWKNNKQKMMRVHRMVLEAFVGPCPAGMEACHNDGNASNNCVENLRWDTRLENMADMERHGTRVRGERLHNAKLTDEIVTTIIRLRSEGVTRESVAARFGVDYETVGDIDRGQTWRHLDHIRAECGPPVNQPPGSTKLTVEQVLAIRRRFKLGQYTTRAALAAEFGVDAKTIRCIVTRATWTHVPEEEVAA